MFAKLVDNEIVSISPTDYDINSGEKWIPIQKKFIENNEDSLESLIGLIYKNPEDDEIGHPEIFTEIE